MLIYRILATLAAPVIGAAFLFRVLRGRESRADLAQRLGAGPGQPGAIWLHGASNGELASARQLVQALRVAFPNHPLLITSNTTSARDLVQGWTDPRLHPRIAPLDLRWILSRFHAQWRPVALIVLENELWPNRITTNPGPTFLLSARMSARSAGRWGKGAGLIRPLLAHVTRLYPQDAESGPRFLRLGLATDRLGPVTVLKSGVDSAPPASAALAPLVQVFRREDTILAASTHEGDEALILTAFQAARQTRPALRLILAPRHPRRAAEILDLIQRTGLPHATRSQREVPTDETIVYLADTLGEMPLWYSLSGITVIGGTFSDRGGHTPFEPAHFGSALIHGPDVTNFADSFAALQRDAAALSVNGSDDLADALIHLSDPATKHAMANAARTTLRQLDTSGAAIATFIEDLKRSLS